jgi:hypothetical protein
MRKHFLTVEDVFDIPAWGGLIVVPGPLQSEYVGSLEMTVCLETPDGAERVAQLKLQQVFVTPPPKEYRWTCILTGASKANVPIGTKIYEV